MMGVLIAVNEAAAGVSDGSKSGRQETLDEVEECNACSVRCVCGLLFFSPALIDG